MDQFLSAQEVQTRHHQLGLKENFCVAPFTTLLLEPDGKVGACRQKGSEFPVGNILHQSFEEIWNGAFLKKWRQEFLEGTPKICQTDIKDKQCNLCPSYNMLLEKTDFKIEQVQRPRKIAFNFNGQCNLECTMCHIWQKENGLYDRIDFWNQIDPWIEDLEDVELLSGEPFIQKDTYKLIDLISVKRPQAKWTITTNANWKFNNFIKKKLDKIEVKNIIVSLDATNEEIYKRIRKKGDFQLALRTLLDLKNYEALRLSEQRSRLNIRVNFLFQKENWQDLKNNSDFCRTEGIEGFKTFLYEPFNLSLLSCSEPERIHMLDWYLDHLTPQDLISSFRVIRPLIDSLQKVDKVYFFDRIRCRIKEA